MAEFELDPNYRTVPERIADFRTKHPDGCLRPLDPARPFWIETVDGRTFIVYAAAAYRTPDDPTPGVGLAWEPFPGKTPFTKDSELQNAETSAWGRAIVAVLASEAHGGVASAEDVARRQAEADVPDERRVRQQLAGFIKSLPEEQRAKVGEFCDQHGIPRVPAKMTDAQVHEVDQYAGGLAAGLVGDPDPVEAVIAEVKAMTGEQVTALIAQLDLDRSGSDAERRRRLAEALVDGRTVVDTLEGTTAAQESAEPETADA